MIGMHEVNDIRKRYKEGDSIAKIARDTGKSEPTVRKYVRMEDLSPDKPAPKARRESCVDGYEEVVRGWLEEDERSWRKQRHSAQRVYERLRDEHGCTASYWTVRRLVERVRSEMGGAASDQYLDLIWEPGTAQCDFGEVEVYRRGARTRMKELVLDFPYSNVAPVQLFGGENAECVCQGLRDIFEHVGGVPPRIVFDNAAGVGRRVCDEVRTTETFQAFSAQYGFSYSFCNPYSGHEKGAVEAKVRYTRSRLFVPTPHVDDLAAFNRRLLGSSMALSEGRAHYIKGVPEDELFLEDSLALSGLPPVPYDVVRYVRRKADKQGKFEVDGRHRYSSDPSLAGAELTVGLRAASVEVYDASGSLVCMHERAYGDAPTDTSDPARQLPLLIRKPGAWRNSLVRASLPERLRDYADAAADGGDVRPFLRLLRDEATGSGWSVALEAMARTLAATGDLDSPDVALCAARIASGDLEVGYDDPPDLGEYDVFFAKGGERVGAQGA